MHSYTVESLHQRLIMHQLVAVAHDVRSMHNVGAIYRTADAAGFSSVICSGYSGAPPDPRIAKVALGAEAVLATEVTPDLDALLDRLTGAIVIVMEQDASSVSVADLGDALAAAHAGHTHAGQTRAGHTRDDVEVVLVACGELTGAPPALIERADIVLELPMRGEKESLNVSVAFGIAAYAVAHACAPFRAADLRSRTTPRPVREGVLTRGVTTGETPAPRA